MTVRKGTYVLLLTFDSDREAEVGALGTHLLHAGTYCYVGSAMGGLDQRVSRHLRRDKRVKWHIDHLTTVCDRLSAWESWPDHVPEGDLARMAAECGMIPAINRFGCSDHPEDGTHLFRADGDSAALLISSCRMEPFRDRRRVL